jgi:hypothetical protein
LKKNISNLKCFIDSDIILDTFLQRENSIYTDIIFQKASVDELMLFTSPIIISNVFYVARKYGDPIPKISKLLTFTKIIPVDEDIILKAIKSDFSDFEDAIQHEAAIKEEMDCIITRNVKDFSSSKITVFSPDTFLNNFFK